MSWWKPRVRRHDCWPPRGPVFEATWTCPTCGDLWTLLDRANSSEWVRDA